MINNEGSSRNRIHLCLARMCGRELEFIRQGLLTVTTSAAISVI